MSRTITLAGYAVVAAAALALELIAHRSHRVPTAGQTLASLLQSWPARLALQAAWLWLGWHLFVRVDWS